MIEREFIKDKAKSLTVKEFIAASIPKTAKVGDIIIEKTPLGERITIYAVKPGLVIGRGGKTIADITATLKTKFQLENPQIEVREVPNPYLSAAVVANEIASIFERFGPSRFKAIGYQALQKIMEAGALGAEIRIGGRGVPGQRARSWLFYAGYMKKSGDIAHTLVDYAEARANLRSGAIGIKVKIMPPAKLPDQVDLKEVEFKIEAEEEEEEK